MVNHTSDDQPDPPKKVISLTLTPVQLPNPLNTQPMAVESDPRGKNTPSPTSRPDGSDSDESNSSEYEEAYLTWPDVILYKEKREKEMADPIQFHLELLYQALKNTDPKFTVFAFGESIASDQANCEQSRLKAWKEAGDSDQMYRE